ncbi:ergothioneine biosynthesis protein EgtC [Frankia sp. AiPa1]|uniref:ergothioneine biosynthesis protein EgtC n=1 Tax=Frankia sp. AiPa1 TaxID=573492 RepID=UPI00202B604F|nr:ergothioneine biosynthesis protein EgtC [Frankia sp. AiPa1]MCL9760676.1 ergothioneine biosynthesis protein EgtC [Frankia sp. AiPa1]
MARPFGLLRQSWAPRRMRHGTINADGYGVGWYAPRQRAEPARYRRAVPMWTDASYASIAGVIASGCVLAAVRNASVGMPVEESATAPFTDGIRLLSHNGRVDPSAVRALLAKHPDAPPPDSACDSALVAALLWEHAAQLPLADAVATVVTALGDADLADSGPGAPRPWAGDWTAVPEHPPVPTRPPVPDRTSGSNRLSGSNRTSIPDLTAASEQQFGPDRTSASEQRSGFEPARASGRTETSTQPPTPGRAQAARLNLLVTDGTQLVATAWGETLVYRVEADGVLVASEPDDDAPGWIHVPDRHLLVADTRKVTLRSLKTEGGYCGLHTVDGGNHDDSEDSDDLPHRDG